MAKPRMLVYSYHAICLSRVLALALHMDREVGLSKADDFDPHRVRDRIAYSPSNR